MALSALQLRGDVGRADERRLQQRRVLGRQRHLAERRRPRPATAAHEHQPDQEEHAAPAPEEAAAGPSAGSAPWLAAAPCVVVGSGRPGGVLTVGRTAGRAAGARPERPAGSGRAGRVQQEGPGEVVPGARGAHLDDVAGELAGRRLARARSSAFGRDAPPVGRQPRSEHVRDKHDVVVLADRALASRSARCTRGPPGPARDGRRRPRAGPAGPCGTRRSAPGAPSGSRSRRASPTPPPGALPGRKLMPQTVAVGPGRRLMVGCPGGPSHPPAVARRHGTA